MKALGGTSFLLVGLAVFLVASGPMTSLANTYIDRISEGKYDFELWPLGVTTLPVWNGPYSQKITINSSAPINLTLVKEPEEPLDEVIVLNDFGQTDTFSRVFQPTGTARPEIFIRFTNPTNEGVRVTAIQSFGPSDFLEFIIANWFSMLLVSFCGGVLLLIGARWLRHDLVLLSKLRTRGGLGIFVPTSILFFSDVISTFAVLAAGGFEERIMTIVQLPILAGWWGLALKFSSTLVLVLAYTAFTYCAVVGDELPRWSKNAVSLVFSIFVGLYSIFLPTNIMNYLILRGFDPSSPAPFLAMVPIVFSIVTAVYSLRVVSSVSRRADDSKAVVKRRAQEPDE